MYIVELVECCLTIDLSGTKTSWCQIFTYGFHQHGTRTNQNSQNTRSTFCPVYIVKSQGVLHEKIEDKGTKDWGMVAVIQGLLHEVDMSWLGIKVIKFCQVRIKLIDLG